MEEKNLTKKEIRAYSEPVTITGEAESRRVEGYACLFDTPSDGLPFEEVIERGAFDGVLAESNVFALLNHDIDRGVLARSKSGTLSLTVDTRGLKYAFDAPHTPLGDELLEYLRRGDVDSSSFAFTVAEDTWEYKNDGTAKRTVKKIERLYDVSPVYDAAYSKTTVYQRSGLDALEAAKAAKEAEEKAAKEAEARAAELESYFEQLDNNLTNF